MSNVSVTTLEEPAWVRTLLTFLAGCYTPHDFFGPLGCRVIPLSKTETEKDCPELSVLVFPTPFEVRYGAADGQVKSPGFTLDVQKILTIFSDVKSLAWHVPVIYNGELDGPELRISGSFVGIRIWLRIFANPPKSEPVSHVYEPATGRFWERW